VVISEPLNYENQPGGAWDDLIYFYDPDDGIATARPLITFKDFSNGNFTVIPGVDGRDTLVFIITNEDGAYTPLPDDEIFLNNGSSYTDLQNNSPGENTVILQGLEPAKVIRNSEVYIPVVGSGLNTSASGTNSGLALGFDPTGAPLGTMATVTATGTTYQKVWVAPCCITLLGTIDEACQASAGQIRNSVDNEAIRAINSECLSTIKVQSEGKYSAEVKIYDHLGKFVHGSTQIFGNCGEMQNSNRNIPSLGKGRASWLVWNMRDTKNEYVGSGVYIWKIIYTPLGDDDGGAVKAEFTSIKKQGIIRTHQAWTCNENTILAP
jgi:hypothetical protein